MKNIKLTKNMKILLGIVAAGCVLIIGFVLSQIQNTGNSENGSSSEQTQAAASANGTDQKTGSGKDNKKEDGTEGTESTEESKDTKDKEKKDGTESKGSSNNDNQKTGQTSEKTPLTEEGDKIIPFSLPYSLSNYDLVIEDIKPYDGMFLEDGSDVDVSGVASMLLRNTGDQPIEFTELTMHCGNKEYQFKATDIPPGAAVVVQEANQESYAEGDYYTLKAHVAVIDELEMSDDVTVEENENSLTVTNVSGSDIPCVRIFYKLFMEDEGIYLGGITYTAKITYLGAGKSIDVTPAHYLQGYSRIMMVRTYDSAD